MLYEKKKELKLTSQAEDKQVKTDLEETYQEVS